MQNNFTSLFWSVFLDISLKRCQAICRWRFRLKWQMCLRRAEHSPLELFHSWDCDTPVPLQQFRSLPSNYRKTGFPLNQNIIFIRVSPIQALGRFTRRILVRVPGAVGGRGRLSTHHSSWSARFRNEPSRYAAGSTRSW